MLIYRPAGGEQLLQAQFSTTDTLTASVITTTETAFATQYALPANYLTTNKLLRVSAFFNATSTATIPTSVITLRLQKSGPTNVNLYTNAAAAFPAGTIGFGAIWYIQGTAAAGAAVSVMCGVMAHSSVGPPAGRNTIATPSTVDTASAQTIQITQTYSSNAASNSITLTQLIVEALN